MSSTPYSRRLSVITILVMVSLILTACARATPFVPSPTPYGSVMVDPVFREFYRALGGETVLGPAISGLIRKEAAQCQFTLAVLLCYTESAPETEHYSLYPIGRELGEYDSPRLTPLPAEARVVDGFVIYQEFVSLYDRLHGARYVGRPLTDVRINYQQRRIEQYFENMGFYRLLDVPEGEVHLIGYGSFACGQACSYRPGMEMAIIGGQPQVEQPIAAWLIRIGGVSVWGQPLTEAYLAADGSLEQIYEKAVFYIAADNPNVLRLRPAPIILGTSFNLPTTRIADSRLIFYPTQGDLGYNVPRVYDEFIATHGGQELAGQPISENGRVPGENIYRQCFQNYCIDYDPAADPSLRLRLAPIGVTYAERNRPEMQIISNFVYSQDTLRLEIGEAKPQVNANDTEEIYMAVSQKSDRRPIADIEGDLLVMLPDHGQLEMHLGPTDANGMSTVVVPPQPALENGLLVPYQVCLNIPSDQAICAQNTYLIWNEP